MKLSSIRAVAPALMLMLLLGVLGAGVASAHHHDEAAAPAESCGLCAHAAPVATTTALELSVEPAPIAEWIEPATDVAVDEGCRSDPRGRGPPVVAPVL